MGSQDKLQSLPLDGLGKLANLSYHLFLQPIPVIGLYHDNLGYSPIKISLRAVKLSRSRGKYVSVSFP